MRYLLNIFSNRELALIIWLMILLLVLFIWDKGRYYLKEIIKYAFVPKLIVLYFSLIIYISTVVVLFWRFRFWDISLLKDTIVWFLFSALGVFFSLNKVKGSSYFWNLFKNSIAITAFIEFFINLYTFSLLVELVIFPCLVFLTIFNVYSEISAQTNKEHKKAHSCLNKLLIIINLVYIGFALYKTIIGFKTIPWADVSKQFILPVVLTISSIPYFWGLALYMKYESMFITNNIIFKERSKIEKLKIKFYILYYGNFSFKRVYRIWKRIGFLAYEGGTNYRKYIKQAVSDPAYKKSPITNKMSIGLFNNIDGCCKSLTSLHLGEFSEWNKLQGLDDFYCSTSYYSIKPYGLSNLLLSLQGEELHIYQLELSLSIYSIEEREEAMLKFKECTEEIFRLLLLQVPYSSISNSILKGKNYNYSNDNFSIELTIEVIGKVESFVLMIKSN